MTREASKVNGRILSSAVQHRLHAARLLSPAARGYLAARDLGSCHRVFVFPDPAGNYLSGSGPARSRLAVDVLAVWLVHRGLWRNPLTFRRCVVAPGVPPGWIRKGNYGSGFITDGASPVSIASRSEAATERPDAQRSKREARGRSRRAHSR